MNMSLLGHALTCMSISMLDCVVYFTDAEVCCNSLARCFAYDATVTGVWGDADGRASIVQWWLASNAVTPRQNIVVTKQRMVLQAMYGTVNLIPVHTSTSAVCIV
jgi:hypothetical protein